MYRNLDVNARECVRERTLTTHSIGADLIFFALHAATAAVRRIVVRIGARAAAEGVARRAAC